MVDLQELINKPGAGAAVDAVKRAGFWDETRAPSWDGPEEAKARKYVVKVEYEITTSDEDVVSVEAISEDEALEKIEDLIDAKHGGTFLSIYRHKVLNVEDII